MSIDTSKVMRSMKCDEPDNPTDPNSWSLLALTKLLAVVVRESNGILDSKYADIIDGKGRELLETDFEFRNTLITAYNNQDFSKVLATNVLRKHSVFSASSNGAKTALSEEQKKKLLLAMSLPYRGAAVNALYEYLEWNERQFIKNPGEVKYYARFCSVVQSSGTGKTRTILELARKGVLLLYMNLRSKADRYGYPVRDDIPADILNGACDTESEYEIRCYALFTAIFKLIREDLSAQCGTSVVSSWNSKMDLKSSDRTKFFERLRKVYDEIKSGVPKEKVSELYEDMATYLASVFPGDSKGPRLVIALDEAHLLHEPEVQGFRRSTVIFRAINSYSGMLSDRGQVWVIFASTTSKVGHFASPEALSNSARVSEHGQLIFPPFCEMGWDQNASSPDDVLPDEVAKASNIIRYGRPLWLSLKDSDFYDLNGVFELAQQKLVARTGYQPCIPEQAIAVLSQRFGLNICLGHRDSVRFIESSVASNLRVCITTTENRTWSYTTYPSEPFLSCAAANLLHFNNHTLGTTFDTLVNKVDSGVIEMGQHGELVSRLLWLIAKDLLVVNKNPSRRPWTTASFNTELVHCSMIPVVELFRFIFGENFWSDLAGIGAETAFKDAYVNFSHWISMEFFIHQDDRKVADQLSLNDWTMRHWQRTCAIQCCHNQPTIDKVIPIYFKPVDPGDRVTDCMSQILISDKARVRKKSDMDTKIKIDRAHLAISGTENSALERLPYIAIVADLGLHKPGLDVTWYSGGENEAPCLCIWACALTEDTYPFLKDCNSKVLSALKYLVERQEAPEPERPVAKYLRGKMTYGSSSEGRYMKWEKDPPEDVLTKENNADTAGPSKFQKRPLSPKQAVEKASKKPRCGKKLEALSEISDTNSNSNPENDGEEAMNIDNPE